MSGAQMASLLQVSEGKKGGCPCNHGGPPLLFMGTIVVIFQLYLPGGLSDLFDFTGVLGDPLFFYCEGKLGVFCHNFKFL